MTLVSIGYSEMKLAGVAHVKLYAVKVLGRVTSLMFLLVVSLFTWLLLSAVIATAFPERKKLSLVVIAVLVVIALSTTAYSITMAVIHSRLQATLVVDVSEPLVAGVSFLFSMALTALWAAAWQLVETKRNGAPGFAEIRRNAVILFVGSAVLMACFLVWFVLAVLELTVDYDKYRSGAQGLQVTSLMLMVLAVLAYTGAAVVAAGKSKAPKGDGYVPLTDNKEAPIQYAFY